MALELVPSRVIYRCRLCGWRLNMGATPEHFARFDMWMSPEFATLPFYVRAAKDLLFDADLWASVKQAERAVEAHEKDRHNG